jgi:hypothetical protein
MILPSGIILNWSNVEYIELKGNLCLVNCRGNSMYISKEDYDYIKKSLTPPEV